MKILPRKVVTFWNLLIILFTGGEEMVVVYATLIIKNAKTFDQVPEKLQAQVKAHLLLLGLDENGVPLEEANA